MFNIHRVADNTVLQTVQTAGPHWRGAIVSGFFAGSKGPQLVSGRDYCSSLGLLSAIGLLSYIRGLHRSRCMDIWLMRDPARASRNQGAMSTLTGFRNCIVRRGSRHAYVRTYRKSFVESWPSFSARSRTRLNDGNTQGRHAGEALMYPGACARRGPSLSLAELPLQDFYGRIC